jgi:DICT domain-containing protein
MYRFRIDEASHSGLSAAQLAARTGLPVGTLRMWQARHGFPSAPRTAGRHRRYTDDDVALVLEVTRLRAQGLSLGAAIQRAARGAEAALTSVFAGLRREHPEIAPHTLGKRPLLALSNALEDEYCARAAGGLLVAAFQRERFYRQAERRWRELARTSEFAVVLGDFPALAGSGDCPVLAGSGGEPDLGRSVGGPVEVPIGPGHPLAREWVLLIDAPGAQACLAAWEQPTQRALPDADRRFEVLWSFEPAVVRSASNVVAELLRGLAPEVARRIPAAALEPVPAASPELRFATSLANRVVGYLAARTDVPRRSTMVRDF